MKKLFVGLAFAGTGYAVYALSKSGKCNNLKFSVNDIPDPLKKKAKESAAISADAIKNSGDKIDDFLVQVAKVIGRDDARVQELIAKIGTMSDAKKKELLKLTGKLNKKLS